MLAAAPGSLQIDATVGGGGHAERILAATDPDGRLLGLDADGAAIARVRDRLGPRFGERLRLHQANFRELAEVAPAEGFGAVDGCFFDLGLSSYQLADANRGFGFRTGGPLDMRFDTSRGVPASELLASLDATELAALFRRFGEEPFAGRVARAIVEARQTGPIETAEELAALIEKVTPSRAPGRRRIHPATRVFQALRIAVNEELEALAAGLAAALDLLRPGRSARRPQLPQPRGPNRQALLPGRAARLRLPAGGARLHLRPVAACPPVEPKGPRARRRGGRRQSPSPERAAPDRGAARRIAITPDRRRGAAGRSGSMEEAPVSKRHQSSRRRSYGRRQHEMAERHERRVERGRPEANWAEAADATQADPLAFLDPRTRATSLRLRGLMAVYQGARKRALELPRPTLDLDLPFAGRRGQAATGLVREGRPTRVGTVLAAIVVAFVLAFLSLSQSVRTAATELRHRPARIRVRAARRPATRSPVEPRPARGRTCHPQVGTRRRTRTARRAPDHSRPLATIGVAGDPRSNRFARPPPVPAARLRRCIGLDRRAAHLVAGGPVTTTSRRARTDSSTFGPTCPPSEARSTTEAERSSSPRASPGLDSSATQSS